MTRRPIDGSHPEGWVPEQKISVKDAVHAYTVGSVYASFQENSRGTLVPGKFADLVVLSHDIFNIEPEEILEAKTDMTIVNGEIVYARDSRY